VPDLPEDPFTPISYHVVSLGEWADDGDWCDDQPWTDDAIWADVSPAATTWTDA
jgi:hypothetical protein